MAKAELSNLFGFKVTINETVVDPRFELQGRQHPMGIKLVNELNQKKNRILPKLKEKLDDPTMADRSFRHNLAAGQAPQFVRLIPDRAGQAFRIKREYDADWDPRPEFESDSENWMSLLRFVIDERGEDSALVKQVRFLRWAGFELRSVSPQNATFGPPPDRRLSRTDVPELWDSKEARQIFMDGLIGPIEDEVQKLHRNTPLFPQ